MIDPIRAIVFDLDGTLLDSMPLVLQAYHHAIAPYRSPMTDAELLKRMGGPPQRIFEQLLEHSTHVTGALERLETYAAQAWQLIKPYPGVTQALDHLRAAEVKLGIWTGRERESTEWLLQAHALTGRIETMVCGDDLPSHKPDPAGLADVLRRLGVNQTDAVFVGDAAVDVEAGAALGVRTIFIAHGTAPSHAVRGAAWRCVDTPNEAYDLLRRQVSPDLRDTRKSEP